MALSVDNTVEQWKKHFIAMAEGKLTPASQYTVGKTQRGMGHQGMRNPLFTVTNQHGSGESSNVIKFVSPVTQTGERATASVKRGINSRKPAKRISSGVKKPRVNKAAKADEIKQTKKKSAQKKSTKTTRAPRKTVSKKQKKDIFS